MAKNSGIEWTDHTFNPWWGCVRVSAGCVHCYAETSSKRWGNDIWGVDKERRFFGDKHWNEPLKWNADAQKAGKPALVFCASMADWLEDRPDLVEPRLRLCALIENTPWLTWLLLTKRIENAARLMPVEWTRNAPKNIWLGVTTEDQESFDERVGYLTDLKTLFGFSKIWLSIEPQIGPIDLRGFRGIDWAIVGGESGPGCRPFNIEWARDLKMQCDKLGITYFLKQLGGHPDKRHQLEQFPEDLRVRDFPR